MRKSTWKQSARRATKIKKYAKGRSIERIAEEVEEDLETVEVILQKLDEGAKRK